MEKWIRRKNVKNADFFNKYSKNILKAHADHVYGQRRENGDETDRKVSDERVGDLDLASPPSDRQLTCFYEHRLIDEPQRELLDERSRFRDEDSPDEKPSARHEYKNAHGLVGAVGRRPVVVVEAS